MRRWTPASAPTEQLHGCAPGSVIDYCYRAFAEDSSADVISYVRYDTDTFLDFYGFAAYHRIDSHVAAAPGASFYASARQGLRTVASYSFQCPEFFPTVCGE